MIPERYDVRLTRGAEDDLRNLYTYRAAHAGRGSADALLASIEDAILGLRHFPHRGAIPGELQSLGMIEYRQILCGPYRIIYRTIAATVSIILIADGRRDLAALLPRRLPTR